MNQDIRNALCDMGHEEAIVFDNPDYDEAIIGVTDEGQVIYVIKSILTLVNFLVDNVSVWLLQGHLH